MTKRGHCTVEVIDISERVEVCCLDAGLIHLFDMPVDLPLIDLYFFHPVIALGAFLAVFPAL